MSTINSVGNGLSGVSGSGSFVGSNSPTMVTPNLDAATATSLNFGSTSFAAYTVSTWTPTLTFSTPGNISVVYVTQTGSFIRIGNIVFLDFTLVCTPTYTTASGTARIAGVVNAPFSNGVYGNIGLQGTSPTYPVGDTSMVLSTSAGGTFFTLSALGSGKASAALTTAQFISGTQVTLGGSIIYNLS